ncbi:IS200/IS605 family accessory protein TnpB-related protein, partial [Microcoleus sp. T2B6]|uniref:IS200/IS605 family accessory protein TnpB-related protein n=1 Tax=Microcoleus sp. T2B6 TaxID=3055424 RepID=UPI002FD2E2E6
MQFKCVTAYWSKRLERLTENRNRTMRDAVNKTARKVINHCWFNKIGTVIFGWNTVMKNGINLGSKTNQNFVQIPTARLKSRIAQLCEQYGIQFVETEESYTSKASVRFVLKKPRNGGNSGSNKVIQYGLSSHFNPLLDDNLFVLWVRTLFKSHP